MAWLEQITFSHSHFRVSLSISSWRDADSAGRRRAAHKYKRQRGLFSPPDDCISSVRTDCLRQGGCRKPSVLDLGLIAHWKAAILNMKNNNQATDSSRGWGGYDKQSLKHPEDLTSVGQACTNTHRRRWGAGALCTHIPGISQDGILFHELTTMTNCKVWSECEERSPVARLNQQWSSVFSGCLQLKGHVETGCGGTELHNNLCTTVPLTQSANNHSFW